MNQVHFQGCPVVNMAADSEELSDTESGAAQDGEQGRRRQSLRLIWNQEWHRDVLAMERFVRDLATRIGPQVEGAPIPSAVRRQRWSLMNVPIMWAAAGQEQNTPVVDWLVLTLHDAPEVDFHGGQLDAKHAGGSQIANSCQIGCGVMVSRDLSQATIFRPEHKSTS